MLFFMKYIIILISLLFISCVSDEEKKVIIDNDASFLHEREVAKSNKCEQFQPYSDIGPGRCCSYIKDNKLNKYCCTLGGCFDRNR